MTDITDNARGPKRITHPYKGPDLPTEVFADPGRHDWYFREKMPDSYARFVRADLAPDALADARVKALEERLIDTAASLAAAISLLERGGKKAAASDKMFVQMLVDYNRSLDRARAALSPTGGNADG